MATETLTKRTIAAEDFPQHLVELDARLREFSFAAFSRETGLRLALEGIKDNFDNQRAADGAAWPPRKEAGDGHPLLILTTLLIQSAVGNAPGALTYIEDRSLAFGVDADVVPYAWVHEAGWEEKNIPARPYMTVPEANLDNFGEALADHLLGELFS